MKKKQFKKLLENLPESIDEVNDVLDDQDIVMIDFMDGEQVLSLRYEVQEGDEFDRHYWMIDTDGCEIQQRVDLDRILRNRILK